MTPSQPFDGTSKAIDSLDWMNHLGLGLEPDEEQVRTADTTLRKGAVCQCRKVLGSVPVQETGVKLSSGCTQQCAFAISRRVSRLNTWQQHGVVINHIIDLKTIDDDENLTPGVSKLIVVKAAKSTGG